MFRAPDGRKIARWSVEYRPAGPFGPQVMALCEIAPGVLFKATKRPYGAEPDDDAISDAMEAAVREAQKAIDARFAATAA